MHVTAYDIAARFVGIREIPGERHHPFIQWCFSLVGLPLTTPDEVPWCGAFCAGPAHLLGLEHPHNPAARAWLLVGEAVQISDARVGFDVVVLKRGPEPQPGPEVTQGAPGHVGYFAGLSENGVMLLGGNQHDHVSYENFAPERVLGVRRLHRGEA